MASHQEGQDLIADVAVREALPRVGMLGTQHDPEQVPVVEVIVLASLSDDVVDHRVDIRLMVGVATVERAREQARARHRVENTLALASPQGGDHRGDRRTGADPCG
jgi:hypothetical protein